MGFTVNRTHIIPVNLEIKDKPKRKRIKQQNLRF